MNISFTVQSELSVNTITATSAGFLYNLSRATDPEDAVLIGNEKWVITFYLLTMVTNLLGSGELRSIQSLV